MGMLAVLSPLLVSVWSIEVNVTVLTMWPEAVTRAVMMIETLLPSPRVPMFQSPVVWL